MARDNRPTSPPRPAPLRVPAAYWTLVAGFTICRSGCVVVPFLSLYLVRHQHFSAADTAQVSAAFGAGWAIGPAISGWLADRIGRRRTLLVSLSSVTAAYLTLPALHTLAALTAAAFVVGLLFDAPRPAVLALVADVVPEEVLGRAYARLYWASNIGAGVAGAVGTALADQHITALFYVAATSNLAFAATVLICRIGTGPRPKTPHHRPGSPATGYQALLRDGRFLALTGLTLLYLCSYQQVLFGLPVAMDVTRIFSWHKRGIVGTGGGARPDGRGTPGACHSPVLTWRFGRSGQGEAVADSRIS